MKTITGVVVGTKMAKTAVVKADFPWRHPVYHKTVRRSRQYLVDDPGGQAKLGGVVVIKQSRPMSKRKHWQLQEVKS